MGRSQLARRPPLEPPSPEAPGTCLGSNNLCFMPTSLGAPTDETRGGSAAYGGIGTYLERGTRGRREQDVAVRELEPGT
jgi:hypothetical protein